MDTGTTTGSSGLERQEIPEMIVRVACSEEQAQSILSEYMKGETLPDSEDIPNALYFYRDDDRLLVLIRLGFALEDIKDPKEPLSVVMEIAKATQLAAGGFVNIRNKYSPDSILKHVVYETLTQYLIQQHRVDTIGGVH